MTKKSTAARAAKSKTVLVATQEIHGGTEKGGTHVLSEGSELTDDQVELLGLDDDAVSNLTARGILIERQARLADDGDTVDPKQLQAETDRADKAEKELAELKTAYAALEQRATAAEAAVKAAAPKA